MSLLVLPVIAGIVLTAAMVEVAADNDFRTLGARFGIGLMMAPPVIGIGLLVWWLATGRWRRAILWLVLTLVISALSAATTIAVALRQSPLLPEESLDWSGWYYSWRLAAS